jgi:hypothetical protein
MRGLVLAALFCAAGARAQEVPPPEPPPPREVQPKLSKEDEELVKELALLEKMELVKNLELFEADKHDGGEPPPRRQP